MRDRLLAASASTIDRLLRPARARGGAGRRRSGATSAVRRGVRVRTFGDWGEPPPGFTEVDLVAHSGPSMAGTFAWTLVLTDVATGWTECVPLPCRDGALVVEALTRLRGVLPFPLRGADFDNDSVFMNEDVVGWCRANGIEVTRSRAYRKNDQAWVEQKNGAVVRRLVGHDRLEGIAATGELGRLYASARLFVNFFQPSFKLAGKRRDGARFSRRYHAPATPHARLLATGGLEPGLKERLAAEFAALDPIALLAATRGSQERIAALAADGGNADPPAPVAGGGLADFLSGLGTAWQAGEVRARTGPGPRSGATGGRASTRSRRSRRACVPGWRPSPTCRPPTCWRGSGMITPAGTPTSSFARCNAGSGTGGGRSPTASCSVPRRRRRRARMPARLMRRRAEVPSRCVSLWI